MFVHLRRCVRDYRLWFQSAEVVLIPSGADQVPVPYIPVGSDVSKNLRRFLRWFSRPAAWIETPDGPALSYHEAHRMARRLSDRFDQRRSRAESRMNRTALGSNTRPIGAGDHPAEVSLPTHGEATEAETEADADAEAKAPDRATGFSTWRLVDAAAITLTHDGARRKDSAWEAWMLKLKNRALRRLPVATEAHVQAVRDLTECFPNFEEAIEQIVRHLVLHARLSRPLSLPPLLLDGPPGIGKTKFVSALATVLGFHWSAFSFAELSGGFLLTGSSGRWAGAGPGLIAKLVIETPDGQVPLMLADEVDKALTGNSYPTETSLIGTLEPLTAARFTDEFLEVPMDIRPLCLIMTCNQLNRVRPEILSRMRVVSIPPPSKAQMPAIIRSVDEGVRAALDGLEDLFEPLDDEIIHAIAALPPRDLGKLLSDGYARACAKQATALGMMRLKLEHLDLKTEAPKQVKVLPPAVVQLVAQQVLQAVDLLLWRPSTRH